MRHHSNIGSWVSPSNIGLEWDLLRLTNALAYYTVDSITTVKIFRVPAQGEDELMILFRKKLIKASENGKKGLFSFCRRRNRRRRSRRRHRASNLTRQRRQNFLTTANITLLRLPMTPSSKLVNIGQ